MKTIFHISPSSIDADNCILICEVNKECFSYAIRDIGNKIFIAAGIYNFDKKSTDEEKATEINDVITNLVSVSGKFKTVCVMYSYGESVLIPFTMYNSAENDNTLSLIHGDISGNTITLTDLITEKEIYNTYRIPVPVLRVITAAFPNAETTHQYSFLVKQTVAAGNKLFVIFYSQKMVVRLIKNGRTELINNYYYNAPEDVSYILLNICRQYEVTNVPLEISGLIEKDSILFKEIYKYFEPVSFATLPEAYNYSEEILQHPSHYFSHLFAIDSCE